MVDQEKIKLILNEVHNINNTENNLKGAARELEELIDEIERPRKYNMGKNYTFIKLYRGVREMVFQPLSRFRDSLRSQKTDECFPTALMNSVEEIWRIRQINIKDMRIKY